MSLPVATFPAFRPDIEWRLERMDGSDYWIIEDPVSGVFHRLGPREAAFFRALDGQTDPRTLLTPADAPEPQSDKLDAEEATQAMKWAVSTQLLQLPGSSANKLKNPLARKEAFNPLFITVPLGNPDKLLGKITPYFAWAFTPAAFWFSLGIMVLAAMIMLTSTDRLADQTRGWLLPYNWLAILTATVVLKIVHELGHGIACKHYGGHVPEVGLLFVVFMPLGYVDATSSWRLGNKWHRMAISAAGIWVELVLSSLAAIAWSLLEPGWLSMLSLDILLVGGLVTVFFNANPLMRYDGYYLLSDWVEIPNLMSKAKEACLRLVSGQQNQGAPLETQSRHRERWLVLYGAAGTAWRTGLILSLALSASHLFNGAGGLMAVPLVFGFFGKPLREIFAALSRMEAQARIRALTFSAFALALFALAGFIPLPLPLGAPAIVDYANMTMVRAGVSARLESLAVESGDTVQAGDAVAVFSDPDSSTLRDRLRAVADRIELDVRLKQQSGDIGDFQQEMARWLGAKARADEAARIADLLTVHAPVSGRVVAARLHNLLGAHLDRGAEILGVAEDSSLVAKAAVSQGIIHRFREREFQRCFFQSRSHPWPVPVQFDRMSENASTDIPHAALTATAGGPLAVHMGESKTEKLAPLLAEPCFLVTFSLPGEAGKNYTPGERGIVRCLALTPIWQAARDSSLSWFSHLWELSSASRSQ